MSDLQPGSIWEKDGEQFCIVQSQDIEMKEAQDARWSPAVSFRRADFQGSLFVRSQDDFRAKYRLVESV